MSTPDAPLPVRDGKSCIVLCQILRTLWTPLEESGGEGISPDPFSVADDYCRRRAVSNKMDKQPMFVGNWEILYHYLRSEAFPEDSCERRLFEYIVISSGTPFS